METECRELMEWSSSSSNYFTPKETTALKEFLHTLNFEELCQLLKVFEVRCLISQEFYCFLHEVYLKQRENMNEMFHILTTYLSGRCTLGLQYVIFVLHNFGSVIFSQQLYNVHQNLIELLNGKPLLVHKIDTSCRKKIQVYFELMKINIQNMVFHDPITYFTNLSNKIRQKIYTTTPCSEERILQEVCDKYVVLLALTIDSLANKTNQIDPDHQLFQDMEAIISMTSCPDLSRCMLYGRRAVVLSFANRKEEGEDLVREGLICADRVSSCLESVDLLYKIVLFRRAWFEHCPQIIINWIYEHTQKALQILENEPEDIRVFWTRRFMFRLLFCFLGLGMRCRFIEHFYCPFYILLEAERLLDKYDSPDTEYRLKMYFSIAKSRLWHLKGDTDTALKHLVKAKEIASKGKYSELKTILEAEQTLFLPDVTPLFIETENDNNDMDDISMIEPIHLPPTYYLPQSINLNDLHVSLTSPSISPIPVQENSPQNEALGNNSLTSMKEDTISEQNNSDLTEEPPRSHDFSVDVIHIKSSKVNYPNV
ncbi:uncharacterized protein LOC133180405 [Saccostrea echinata]|uniref:uncharacterized protein LOC133180405 n=1 Tax=Saccostrea echinata TaxID=191078 RepID=UPI002A7ED3D1|nr:uncharacterized protein LOC133180405 [Saccostrea echinata]